MAGLTKEQKAAKALLAKAIELSGLSAEKFESLDEQERADWSKNAQDALDLVAQEERRLADEAAAASASSKSLPEDAEPDYSGLVQMEQDEEEIHVHPSCVDDHKRLGWKEV
ncbi:hypothetical protein SAMN05660489_04540 [Pseudomonas sp. LAMO17WK12:I10]|uniref:hypothetical protein n=1 Tax=unclassified Pseudomonas TaxID=196821 RepID=UPI000BCDC6BE|nr:MULTISPECIES: hypothetical protein [unclassified Pseudomonas]PXX59515.1 hypothetical protein H160_04635 [Pseudomonas sp. LAMO17WK12:I9]SNY46680.1 hypothetical protein SAMN05660489_04540 [Pseudomonas sp. LAMO17WK12:I10]